MVDSSRKRGASQLGVLGSCRCQVAQQSDVTWAIGSRGGPTPEGSLDLLAAGEDGYDLNRSGNASVEVLQGQVCFGVETLKCELPGGGIPAGAVAVLAVGPVVAELERVPSPRWVSSEKVRVADVGSRGGTVLAHAGTWVGGLLTARAYPASRLRRQPLPAHLLGWTCMSIGAPDAHKDLS